MLLLTASCTRGASSPSPEQQIGTGLTAFISLIRTSKPGDLDPTFARSADALHLRRTGTSAAGSPAGYRAEMFLRRTTMPGGPREWITLSLRGETDPVDTALAAALGPANGRGFGDEAGWLLPNGGLILERWSGRSDLTFSPGPPQDALEDLARPHLPSLAEVERRLAAAGWRAMPVEALSDDFAQKRLRKPGQSQELLLLHKPSAARLVAFAIDEPTDDAAVNAVLATAGIKEVRLGRCVAHGNYFVVVDRGRVTIWRRPFAMWNVMIQERCA